MEPPAAAVTVEVDGIEVASGTGAAIFGDPIKSIQWLATHQELVDGPVRLIFHEQMRFQSRLSCACVSLIAFFA